MPLAGAVLARRGRSLVDLPAEYAARLDNLPPGLAESATAEALRAIVDYALGDLESVKPPRGFGQD